MPTAYLFCPENDIALAHGSANFTPPRQAALLARHGAPLMWWLGTPDDYVLLPPDLDHEEMKALDLWRRNIENVMGQGPEFVQSLRGLDLDALQPWGWSAYTAAKLLHAGAPKHLIPDPRAIETIRQKSHRRSSVLITDALAGSLDFPGGALPVSPRECRDMTEVTDALRQWGKVYAKSPWSSSGRGVFTNSASENSSFLQRCTDTIKRQGSVMVERSYPRVSDFAMLFRADRHGHVMPSGLSMFTTRHGSSYAGNMLAPDSRIFNILSSFCAPSLLHSIRIALTNILEDYLCGCYVGSLGVDMMIAESGQGYSVVPCVELNLRCTMGVVAHAVAQKTGSLYNTMNVEPAGLFPREDEHDILPLVPANRFFSINATCRGDASAPRPMG